ncbi:MAG: hypothetical protein AAFN13_14470 [Bacteroidota bacterium]
MLIPAIASGSHPVINLWVMAPHAVLALIGCAALLFGSRDQVRVIAAVGSTSLVITALVYAMLIVLISRDAVTGFFLYLFYPVGMWLATLVGSLICGVAVYRPAAFRRTVH